MTHYDDHLFDQVAVEQGESCGRDLKMAADRVSQSEQEVRKDNDNDYHDEGTLRDGKVDEARSQIALLSKWP